MDPSWRDIVRAAGLRATGIRLDVYGVLAEAEHPLSHREVSERLPALDRVSVFRNLGALADAGLVRRLELGDHTFRFELAEARHRHAHFTCRACGDVTCLDEVGLALPSDAPQRLSALLADADIQLRGLCEGCR